MWLQVVEIPYIDEHLSMFVFLPRTKTGLAEFESKLTADKLTVSQYYKELIWKNKGWIYLWTHNIFNTPL